MVKEPESALIAIAIEGMVSDRILRARVARRVRRALARLGQTPLSAHVHFTDENGPKGGVSVRCALTIPLPRRAPVHVAHVAETLTVAFDGALDTVEQRLAQTRRRERTVGRRPKKYYAAKRALPGGASKA